MNVHKLRKVVKHWALENVLLKLWIHRLRERDKSCIKLASSGLDKTHCLEQTITLAYNGVRTLQIRNVFMAQAPRFIIYRVRVSCGLYNKHITIVNDDSVMTLQVVASPTIVILTTLEVSFMLLANIYSRGVTRDDRRVTIVIYL